MVLAGVESRILPERIGGGLDRLLIARRERAQGMLNAVAELAEHRLRDIERILRHEIDADALRADETHDLLDLLEQLLRRIVEEEMRLVEEEDELRLFGIADLRQLLEQFGQQPEQEGGVETRRAHELFGREHVDDAAPVAIGFHKIADIQRRLAEEIVCALLFEDEQAALDRADRRRRRRCRTWSSDAEALSATYCSRRADP